MLRTWQALAFGLIFLPISASAQCPANYQKYFPHNGEAHCAKLSDDTWQWSISRPEVDQRLTEYRDIQFALGEAVSVSASGCVNVDTRSSHDWRRYVDPVGPQTDRLYHGLIWIPGANIWHGTPFVTAVGTDLVRISSVSPVFRGEPSQSEQLIIGEVDPDVGSWLRLGYEADVSYELVGYDGSKYNDHGNHCDEIKDDAKIVITVTSRPHIDKEPSRNFLLFDPIAAHTDGNGFMQSPMWFGNLDGARSSGATDEVQPLSISADCGGFPYKEFAIRVSYGVDTQCTQQASYDEPTKTRNSCLFAPSISQYHGHVNWVPATYVGRLRFQDFSPDGDLDFQLQDFADDDRLLRFSNFQPEGRIGSILTRDSQQEREYKDSLWLEFAGYEVTEHFSSQPTDPGWQLFHYPKDNPNGPSAKQLKMDFRDKTAVVTGLLNLDCVHDCHTELHPVLAMAIRTRCEVMDVSNEGGCAVHGESAMPHQRNDLILEDDPWMIFVRTQGDEGDCALGQHYLDRTEFSFFLPAPLDAELSMPQSVGANFLSNVEGLTWEIQAVSDRSNRGVRVIFHLLPTGRNLPDGTLVRINGVLHLKWTPGPSKTISSNSNDVATSKYDGHEVVSLDERTPRENVTPPSDQGGEGAREYDKHLRCQEFEQNSKSKPVDIRDDLKALKDYGRMNFGIFQEVLLYHDFSEVAPDIGGRIQVLTTSLGAFEVEGAVGIPRTITSSTGQRVTVDANNWMAGVRIGLPPGLFPKLHPYWEIKLGGLIRDASSGFAATPEFKHFNGYDGFLYSGVGIQPRGDESQFSVRLSAGFMYVWSTNELLLRLTVGPTIRRLPKISNHRLNL